MLLVSSAKDRQVTRKKCIGALWVKGPPTEWGRTNQSRPRHAMLRPNLQGGEKTSGSSARSTF